MNDINEKLSALFDGELESSQADEVLESVGIKQGPSKETFLLCAYRLCNEL